jgi:ABC-type uncharacterized transport system auxiliary subunit
MRKFAYAILSLVSAILLGGCLFGSSGTTEIYTLPQAKEVCPEKTSVTIVGFQDTSGTGRNMIYKTSEYRVSRDNYNRWQQYPSELLTAYLRQAFANRGKNLNHYLVRGNFNSFIIDLEKKELSFQVTYIIAQEETQMDPPRFAGIYKASFTNSKPTEFARAFNEAAKQFAADLSKKITAKNSAKK